MLIFLSEVHFGLCIRISRWWAQGGTRKRFYNSSGTWLKVFGEAIYSILSLLSFSGFRHRFSNVYDRMALNSKREVGSHEGI